MQDRYVDTWILYLAEPADRLPNELLLNVRHSIVALWQTMLFDSTTIVPTFYNQNRSRSTFIIQFDYQLNSLYILPTCLIHQSHVPRLSE